MTHEKLEAIEARCNASTSGPWRFEHTPYNDDPFRVGNNEFVISKSILSKQDANFIAQAKQDIPALIAEVKRLTRERDAAVADLNYFAGNFCDSCIHFHTPIEDAEPCHKCTVLTHSDTSYWQWRGVQEAGNA